MSFPRSCSNMIKSTKSKDAAIPIGVEYIPLTMISATHQRQRAKRRVGEDHMRPKHDHWCSKSTLYSDLVGWKESVSLFDTSSKAPRRQNSCSHRTRTRALAFGSLIDWRNSCCSDSKSFANQASASTKFKAQYSRNGHCFRWFRRSSSYLRGSMSSRTKRISLCAK